MLNLTTKTIMKSISVVANDSGCLHDDPDIADDIFG